MATQNVAKPAGGSTGSGIAGSKRKQSDTATESRKKPKDPKTQNLLVSLDPGTEFCKAAICLFQESQAGKEDTLDSLKRVKFSDDTNMVRSQIAFKNTTDRRSGQTTRVPLFGCEVDKALARNEIEPHEVIRHFKPMIYKGHMATQRKPVDEMSELQGRMEKLHLEMEQNLNAVGEFSTNHHLDDNLEKRKDWQSTVVPLKLFAQLLRWLLHRAIQYAIDQYSELQWPRLEQSSDLDMLLKTARNIHIAIAIPADCSIIHKQHILAAAKSAGIRKPWPYLVSEPAAAFEYYLATLEGRKLSPQKSYMLVDIGGGSADMQVWSVQSTSPLKAIELLPPVTEWVGGSEVNGDAVAHVMQAIPDLNQMLHYARGTRIQDAKREVEELKGRLRAPGPETVEKIRRRGLTRARLEQEIAESFEHEKRIPADARTRLLKVAGVPMINGSMFRGGHGIWLKEGNMKKIYKRCLDTITSTITSALHNLSGGKVDEILVCGGASSNLHVQEEIIKAVNGVKVNFLIPPESLDGFHLVALGGLLLLAKRSISLPRMVQREYFTWTIQENDDVETRITRDSVPTVTNEPVAKFFTWDRQPLSSTKHIFFQGQSHLRLDKVVTNNEGKLGWYLENLICWKKPDFPEISEGTRLSDAEGCFESFPLGWFLSKDDVSTMPLKETQDGVSYHQCQYLIGWILTNTNVRIAARIPRSGLLSRDGGPGKDPYRFVEKLHAEALLHPIGTADKRDQGASHENP